MPHSNGFFGNRRGAATQTRRGDDRPHRFRASFGGSSTRGHVQAATARHKTPIPIGKPHRARLHRPPCKTTPCAKLRKSVLRTKISRKNETNLKTRFKPLSAAMRQDLVDWMSCQHASLDLADETFHLALRYLDTFLLRRGTCLRRAEASFTHARRFRATRSSKNKVTFIFEKVKRRERRRASFSWRCFLFRFT